MSDRTYQVLKWIALILLPSLGTLYFAIANIWGLPYAEEIVGTITAIDAFLGALLGVSTSSYKKGLQMASEIDKAVENVKDKEV